MTIHYHGTPITPRAVLDTLAGRHFCVSFAAPADVKHCHAIGQSVMLDNGGLQCMDARSLGGLERILSLVGQVA